MNAKDLRDKRNELVCRRVSARIKRDELREKYDSMGFYHTIPDKIEISPLLEKLFAANEIQRANDKKLAELETAEEREVAAVGEVDKWSDRREAICGRIAHLERELAVCDAKVKEARETHKIVVCLRRKLADEVAALETPDISSIATEIERAESHNRNVAAMMAKNAARKSVYMQSVEENRRYIDLTDQIRDLDAKRVAIGAGAEDAATGSPESEDERMLFDEQPQSATNDSNVIEHGTVSQDAQIDVPPADDHADEQQEEEYHG